MKTARVVGAGLSGLAAACCLRDAGFHVVVFESAAAPGGLIGTVTTPQGLVERAANAFVWTDTTARWFDRLGITPEFPLEVASRRYIFRDGTPRRWPLRPMETATMAARLGWAFARRTLRPREDESVATFAKRVAGPASSEWLMSPAMQGIYAASADELSAAAVFGSRRRARGRSATPAGGMSEFINRLHDDLRRRDVEFTFGAAAELLDGTVPTVICTSASDAAPLVKPHAPRVAEALEQIRMNGLETVTAFFEPAADDLQGFGVLFPRGAGVDALGVLFNTSIFRGRSLLRSETWIYELGNTTIAPTPVDRIAADRQVLTSGGAAPVAVYPTRRPRALPVYDRQITKMAQLLDELPPWLALSGNYLGQIGVSTLLARAETTVASLVARQ